MNIIEQFALIEQAHAEELREMITVGCFWALGAILAGLLVWGVIKGVSKMTTVFSRGSRVGGFVALAAIVALVAWGGVGSGWSINFIQNCGLTDAGSTVDQNTGVVEARWTYSPLVAGYDFKWYYTLKYANGEGSKGPFQLPDAKVSDGHATAIIPESGYSALTITCYTCYVPPVQVVTNGVYHVNGVMRSMNDAPESPTPKFVTPGVKIQTDGGVYLTPTNEPPETAIINTLNMEGTQE